MKLSKKAFIALPIFVLFIMIPSTTLIKAPSVIAQNEVKDNRLAIKMDIQQIEEQKSLQAKQKFAEQKKLEVEAKSEVQKKIAIATKAKEQNKQKETSRQLITLKDKSSQSKSTGSTPPAPQTNRVPQLLIDRIKSKENAEQAIVVTTNGFNKVNAVIRTFEKVNGVWKQIASFARDVGIHGFAYNKAEGDGHSPIGIFSLGTAFGRQSNPGTSLKYRQSTPNDFWVDDVNSPLYNTWEVGPVDGRWNSAENMYIPQYDYGFVINYNTSARTPGKGSAIFFHVWRGADHGTSGCTAAAEDNVIKILRWIKPAKNPIIIEGPMSEILKM